MKAHYKRGGYETNKGMKHLLLTSYSAGNEYKKLQKLQQQQH